MDQKKIGVFLKELRREKNLTQEQLAQIFGVTNRSVSRWENGVNMPDFDLVIEIAKYYEISIEEFLDGERKDENMAKREEERVLKVAEYENAEKIKMTKRIRWLFLAAIAAFGVYGVIDLQGLASTGVYENIASCALGFVFGMLLFGFFATTRYMAKVRAFKQRLFSRAK